MDKNLTREYFKNNLSYYSQLKNKTQADIARNLDISTGLVSDWFNGNKLPRMDNVERLAKCLNVLTTDLLENPNNRQQKQIVYVKEPILYNDIIDNLKNLNHNELLSLKGVIDFILRKRRND